MSSPFLAQGSWGQRHLACSFGCSALGVQHHSRWYWCPGPVRSTAEPASHRQGSAGAPEVTGALWGGEGGSRSGDCTNFFVTLSPGTRERGPLAQGRPEGRKAGPRSAPWTPHPSFASSHKNSFEGLGLGSEVRDMCHRPQLQGSSGGEGTHGDGGTGKKGQPEGVHRVRR